MRPLVLVVFGFLVLSIHSYSQSRPVLEGTLKPGGVMSRNMELLQVLPFRPYSGEQFFQCSVPYMDGQTQKTKQLLLTALNEKNSGTPYPKNPIRIIDVTDPRNISNDAYLDITVSDADPDPDPEVSGTPRNMGWALAYADESAPEAGTFNGDVFLLGWVENLIVKAARPGDTIEITARFVVINLSRAVELRESGSSNHIEIYNASVRNVKYGEAILNPANTDIYIGYIKAETDIADFRFPHTLGFDQKSGVLTLPTLDSTAYNNTKWAFVDMFDLKTISAQCQPNSVTLGQISRITMSGGLPVYVERIGNQSTGPLLYPHDVVPHYLDDGKVRLFIASSANGVNKAGGIAVADVDYTTPTAATVTLRVIR